MLDICASQLHRMVMPMHLLLVKIWFSLLHQLQSLACIVAAANDHIQFDIASKLWLGHALWEDSITWAVYDCDKCIYSMTHNQLEKRL